MTPVEALIIGAWFWPLVLMWLVVSAILLADQRFYFTGAIFLVFIALVHFTGVSNLPGILYHAVFNDPVYTAGAVFSYLVVGFIWSLIKFKLSLRATRVQINKLVEMDKANKGGPAGFNTSKYEIEKMIKSMEVSNNVDALVTWTLFFPISMLAVLVGDFLVDVLRWLFEDVFGKFLHNMVAEERSKLQL